MTSQRVYTTPVELTQWKVPGHAEATFNWEYDAHRDRLLGLYEKGKDQQWNATHRIDWNLDVDPSDLSLAPDEIMPIYGSRVWDTLSRAQKDEVRHHYLSWSSSQFLHGEQGALICSAKIVQTVPDMDSKFYAATQTIDEARHVETYSRYIHEKLQLAYPINPSLKSLLNDTITDSRWDFTYLGMQVLIEGVALAAFSMIRDSRCDFTYLGMQILIEWLAIAAFGLIRDSSQNPLASAINAYVMQDEARHVAFGRLSLKDYYPQLTQKERDEREEFVVEASFLMRDRFMAAEVWDRLGYPSDDFQQYVENAPIMVEFRKLLFSRIVPTIKDIGLWGPKVQRAYAEMGVIDFQTIDPEEASIADERFADELDARKDEIERTISSGAGK